jgi:proton-dependent oligopeptide transporter, POT family
MINEGSTVLGLYYLAFFAANALVGWVGGLYEKLPTPRFWLLHAAFAVGSGAVFLLFKLFLSPYLLNGASETENN